MVSLETTWMLSIKRELIWPIPQNIRTIKYYYQKYYSNILLNFTIKILQKAYSYAACKNHFYFLLEVKKAANSNEKSNKCGICLPPEWSKRFFSNWLQKMINSLQSILISCNNRRFHLLSVSFTTVKSVILQKLYFQSF
jgi:hypothetical protein